MARFTPLDDAVTFGQWRAAHRVVEREAQNALWHAAALWLMDRVEEHFAGGMRPARHPWGKADIAHSDVVTIAFWCVCHGSQRQSAEYLLERGAELNWISVWYGLTPLDASRRAGAYGAGRMAVRSVPIREHDRRSRIVPVRMFPKRYLLPWTALPVLLLGLASPVAFGRAPQDPTSAQQAGSLSIAVSKSGIPYRPDDAGPRALVDAIRARRPGGKLLNLDRMLLHSPPFAQGWNGMFAAIRGELSLSPKLRELAIMSIAVLNRADYEWVQHEKEFFAAGGTLEQKDALRKPAAALADERSMRRPRPSSVGCAPTS